jgi:hypothetical protein
LIGHIAPQHFLLRSHAIPEAETMKRSFLVLALTLLGTTVLADDVIKRGAALSSDAKPVALAKVLESPQSYTKDAVLVEGVIESSCTNKGCWMQLVPAEGGQGVRVTFKDYGFFIPLQAKGMKARAEGVATVKTLSKADADHLEGEGAKLKRNADGTANEVSFVANGVELTK